jgi:hypothetical protein
MFCRRGEGPVSVFNRVSSAAKKLATPVCRFSPVTHLLGKSILGFTCPAKVFRSEYRFFAIAVIGAELPEVTRISIFI